jgi:hypothetical protein
VLIWLIFHPDRAWVPADAGKIDFTPKAADSIKAR